MISIVTAYFNRKALFKRTLESIKNQNFNGGFEVIAVDDGSREEERLEDLVSEFPFLKVIRMDPAKKWYSNSCIPFNVGFKAAKGDKVILQNPECLHFGNILDFTSNNLSDENYISFACFSLDKPSTENLEQILATPGKIEEIIEKDNHVVKNDGDAGWYNHSVYRPEAFHFCTAISKKNLDKLGGFDELFSLGIAFDDNEFLWRIKKMRLRIDFVDSVAVLHQNHYSPQSVSFENRKNKEILMERNREIYNLITMKSGYAANKYISKLPLSRRKPAIKRAILLKKLWTVWKTENYHNKLK